jgi:hypothetical protein
MKKIILLNILFITLSACNNKKSCNELTGSYTNFVDARKEITKAYYPVKKIQSTPESSWIKRIEFYSCDQQQGYLIIYTTRSEEYIHANVPMKVWDELSTSTSKGSYYNANIINRYPFHLKSS